MEVNDKDAKWICDFRINENEICGRTYTRAWNCWNHKKTHYMSTKPYTCNVCKKKFGDRSACTRHLDIKHLRKFKTCTCGKKCLDNKEVSRCKKRHK